MPLSEKSGVDELELFLKTIDNDSWRRLDLRISETRYGPSYRVPFAAK